MWKHVGVVLLPCSSRPCYCCTVAAPLHLLCLCVLPTCQGYGVPVLTDGDLIVLHDVPAVDKVGEG